EYFRIIELKTATLFAIAAELGAKLNNAPALQVEALANFGRHLGAAYQIYDDCIDLAGRESATGKTLGTDLRKGKMTLPMLRLLNHASAIEKERYCQLILEGDYASHRRAREECGGSGRRDFGEIQDAEWSYANVSQRAEKDSWHWFRQSSATGGCIQARRTNGHGKNLARKDRFA